MKDEVLNRYIDYCIIIIGGLTLDDIRKLFNLKKENEKPISSEKFFEYGMSKEDYMMYLSLCDGVKSACVMAYFEWTTRDNLVKHYKEQYTDDSQDISVKEKEKKYQKYCSNLYNNKPNLNINYYDLVVASLKTLISFLGNFKENSISLSFENSDLHWLINSCYYRKVRESMKLYGDMLMIKSLDDFRSNLEYLISLLLIGNGISYEFSKDIYELSYEELLEYEVKIKKECEKYPRYEYIMSFDADNYNEITNWAKENEAFVIHEEYMELLEEIDELKEEHESRKIIEDKVKKNFEDEYKEIEEIFDKYNRSSALICLQNSLTGEILALIVAMSTRTLKDNIIVIDYRDKETRKLLTDIYKNNKEDVVYNGIQYNVFKHTDSRQIISSLELKPLGGLASSIKGQKYPFTLELVDILLYSPYSKMYEVCQATCIKASRKCYMDPNLYRRFVKTYGNPGIKLNITSRGSYHIYGLSEESMLHELGYNVDKKNDMGQLERQELLKDIIDMDLMNQDAIIRLLGMLINLNENKSNNALAVMKWKSDFDFVSGYRYNPERFLISRY